MKFYVTVLIGVASLLLSNHSVQAEDLSPKDKLVIELLEESKIVENVTTLIRDQLKLGLIKALNKNGKKVPDKYLNEAFVMLTEAFEEKIPVLMKPMIQLYSDAFTEEELRQLITFQKSPLGRKSSRLMPHLIQQGMVIGRKWGQEAGKLAFQRMKEKFKKDDTDI